MDWYRNISSSSWNQQFHAWAQTASIGKTWWIASKCFVQGLLHVVYYNPMPDIMCIASSGAKCRPKTGQGVCNGNNDGNNWHRSIPLLSFAPDVPSVQQCALVCLQETQPCKACWPPSGEALHLAPETFEWDDNACSAARMGPGNSREPGEINVTNSWRKRSKLFGTSLEIEITPAGSSKNWVFCLSRSSERLSCMN